MMVDYITSACMYACVYRSHHRSKSETEGEKADAYILIVVEAVGQGIHVGGSEVYGVVFADDFIGMCATPNGLQK